ncbi:MAG: ABC transporter ATP-binding protein [Acidobacteriota bacterium]|nr:ABC transporter ATP-binding protein [Acidobacteriota bacterium]
MSNVQCPKSQTDGFEAAEPRESPKAAIQGEEADIEHWTLDIGLRVTDLRKSFLSPGGERIEVLRGASFSARAGETVAIMGASGAGKSTLLHLLGGLEAADHGNVVAGEFVVDRAKAPALARFRSQQVGFVFQFHHLLPDLTTLENVSLPLMIARTSRAEAMFRSRQILKKVGLDNRISHLVGHLSGGERQRVAVCRALITRPALVLADEPTGNLDMAIGDEIALSLVSYARENRALVVIATHNRDLAALCDRVLILRDGRLCNSEEA